MSYLKTAMDAIGQGKLVAVGTGTDKLVELPKEGEPVTITADQVRELDYAATAPLCSVELGEKGESPAEFFYETERVIVANEIERLERDAKDVAKVEAIRAALASAGIDAVCTATDDGVITVEVTRWRL